MRDKIWLFFFKDKNILDILQSRYSVDIEDVYVFA